MTTGSKTWGVSSTWYYAGYKTKTWSGANSPRVRRQYEVIPVTHKNSFISVRKGKRVVRIKYDNHFVRRLLPPARAFQSEHNYSCRISIRDFKENWGYNSTNRVNYHVGPNTWGQGSPVITWKWDSNDDLALIGRLRTAVAGSDFNAGVFLGEGHEALKMIANSATRIYKAYKAARKGNFVSARRYLVSGSARSRMGRKTVANNWLELQYGWLPLLKDAEGAAQFLAHQLSYPLQHVVKVRSSRKLGSVVSSAKTVTFYPNALVYSVGQIKAILKEKDVVSLVGLTDPLSVQWELLPYSFVLDWFIPIGNYLSARGLSQSLTGTFVTTRMDYAYSPYGWAVYPVNTTTMLYDTTSDFFKEISVNRVVSSSLSIPVPSVKPLGKVLSWRHAANAVALLSQLK